MYELDREHARAEVGDSDADELATRLQAVDEEERAFAASVFDEEKYAELQRAGKKRLSFKAAQAALMINVYRDEPVFQMAYKTLTALVDVDQALTAWRQKHAQMVHRMLGHRSGTGGSSGYHYLKATATAHRVFADLCDVSTYLIPRTMVPRLPESVVKSLRFHYSGQE
jgi:tryptophan 2,3-dioxygenase